MAMKDDDEEEYVVNSAGVARYPCMPSEVALQQMRNRMQLAKLGKKLMKWSAVASSREMRTLGLELEAAYDELNEKLQDAYIMLARSRYFNANLNNIVTENVGKNAAVLVDSRLKARSGVKIMQQEIIETNRDPYIYLGIEKGGENIMEAKKKWLEIIRMLILIMQLRATFLTVEKANMAANKKKNVFTRIIIPRTIETIAYIESGLEELAREDFFRLRRFIYKKRSESPSYQERKPMEIKERLLPKASKRIYKIECFVCGAFLRFSLVDERQKYLERRKVEELRFQMNEMLQIAKKLEVQGIVDINVDEFIVTAEKLKEKLNESPHIDQLCRTCKELLKRKHEKEKKKQELQNVNTESIALQAELLAPTIGIPKEKTDKDETKMLETPTQDFNIEQIEKDSKSIKLKLLDERTNEPEPSNKRTETFTEIYGDAEEDFTKLKERSVESTKKEISTITITKELKSELSLNNQTLLDSPLETSIEKIKRVVTDEKENKSFVEEKFIITIKEKIKNVIGKISKSSQNLKNSINENNNQAIHEMTTVIKIDSRLSSEPMSSKSREGDLMSNSGFTIEDKKSKEPTLLPPSTASNNQIVKVGTPPPSLISSEGALEQKAPQFKDFKNNSHFSSFSSKPKTIETMKKELKDENSNKPTSPRSTSFTDVIISDTTIEDEFTNEATKISTSMPSLYISIDEPQDKIAQTNDVMDSFYLSTEAKSSEINLISTMPYAGVTINEDVTTEPRTESTLLTISDDQTPRISTDPKGPENKERIHNTYAIQIKANESNKISTLKENSKDQTPQKRVQINNIRRSNSLPTVNRTGSVTPLGSISYAGISGVYMPPQNPTEILSEPCICVSSTTLLSTELDTNSD